MTTLPWTSRPFFGPGDFGIHWGVLRELKNRHSGDRARTPIVRGSVVSNSLSPLGERPNSRAGGLPNNA